LSDKLLLRARPRSFGGEERVARGKNRGCSAAPSTPALRHSGALLCAGDAAGAAGKAAGEGSGMAEKVDQYQAKRSAPTNLCGDPSNDTSRCRCSRIDFADADRKKKKSRIVENRCDFRSPSLC